jgi:rhodanese-related sulfurtransferase
LANAINIDVEAGVFDQEIATLDKSATYAVYCRSGRRSGIATEKMAKAGFTSVFNLKQGGFTELAQLGVATA